MGVSLRGVRKVFPSAAGPVVAVDGIDLDVADGEFFSMLGPSGSGKTTVLRMIAGFEQPTEGGILLDGVDVSRLAPFQRDVNTVFQDYALFPHLSVADNVGYGLRVKKVPRDERRRRVEEALETVRLAGFGRRRPAQLSGGQRQRVAVARALVNRPKVLLLDEPLGALDLRLREEMQVELKSIQREVGVTFLFVTHDQGEALTMSDRIAVFDGGRIEQVGTPAEIYDRPATAFVAGFVGTSNLLAGPVAQRLLGVDGRFVLRPERVRPVRPDDPIGQDDVAADGVVAEVVYAGAETRLYVDLDAGTRMVAARPNAEGGRPEFAPGDRLRLTWHRDQAFRLPDTAADAAAGSAPNATADSTPGATADSGAADTAADSGPTATAGSRPGAAPDSGPDPAQPGSGPSGKPDSGPAAAAGSGSAADTDGLRDEDAARR